MPTRRRPRNPPNLNREKRSAILEELGYQPGDAIRCVHESRTVFTISGAGLDGSLTCSAGQGTRSLDPQWCFDAYRINRRGRRVLAPVPDGLEDAYREHLESTGRTWLNRTDNDAEV